MVAALALAVAVAAPAAAAGRPHEVQLPPWPATWQVRRSTSPPSLPQPPAADNRDAARRPPACAQMNLSTIIQPCNDSGPFDPAFGSKFGIADYDWSNMKNVWVNTKPMDCEKLLVKQAQMNRKLNPQSRAFVYRNLVKALNWFGSVREKLDDPAYSGFFLKFDPTRKGKYHVPACDISYTPPKCSVFYHDQEQSPGHPKGDGNCVEKCDCGKNPCGEYLWCANTTWPRHTPRGQPEALHTHSVPRMDGSALRSAARLGNGKRSDLGLGDHWWSGVPS